MCMIALRPAYKGGNIPKAVLETALDRHPDGYGIAWREPGVGLQVERFGPLQRKEFRALMHRIDPRHGIEYVAHFRQATHGPKAASHAHPFEYMDKKHGRVLVFHNGIFSVTTKPQESDTEVFTRDILANLPSGWWRNNAILDLVSLAGGWSRVVVMTETETINIDERDGKWDGGLWYSSTHTPYAKQNGYSGKSWSSDDATWASSYRSDEIASKAVVPIVDKSYLWAGRTEQVDGKPHRIEAITAIRAGSGAPNGDYEDAAICVECDVIGSVFVYDGTAYTAMLHTGVTESGDEDAVLVHRNAAPMMNEAELINAAAAGG